MNLKEAIDKLYNLAVNNGIGQYEGSYEQAFDMVIEELEKKDTEIIEAKEANRQLSLELEKYRKTKDLYYENKELRKTLRLKDKVINEMAGHIILMNDSRGLTNEEKIKYFIDMVEREGK